MYNKSVLKGGKKMLIITFGTLTNYSTSKSFSDSGEKRGREREVEIKGEEKMRVEEKKKK